MNDFMSRSSDRLRSPGEGPRQARPTTPGDHHAEVPAPQALPRRPGAAPSRAPDGPVGPRGPGGAHGLPQARWRAARGERRVRHAQALTLARTWVRYGGPDAAPVTTDGPLPETSDLVAGWYMVDVESRERALELAAYISSEPGPGGEPLYEWIDVREVMSGASSEPDPA